MKTDHDIIGQTIMRATPATVSNPPPRVSLSRRHRHEDYYAFINPFKLDEVKYAKVEVDIHGMTVTEVKGFGRQKGDREVCLGPEYTTDFVATVKIEVFAQDNLIPPLVETITHSAKTGIVSDGKVFVRISVTSCGSEPRKQGKAHCDDDAGRNFSRFSTHLVKGSLGAGCRERLLALFPPLPRRDRLRIGPQAFSRLSGFVL